MTRQQLTAAYIDLVGYDPFEDSPDVTESQVAEMLREYEAEAKRDRRKNSEEKRAPHE